LPHHHAFGVGELFILFLVLAEGFAQYRLRLQERRAFIIRGAISADRHVQKSHRELRFYGGVLLLPLGLLRRHHGSCRRRGLGWHTRRRLRAVRLQDLRGHTHIARERAAIFSLCQIEGGDRASQSPKKKGPRWEFLGPWWVTSLALVLTTPALFASHTSSVSWAEFPPLGIHF